MAAKSDGGRLKMKKGSEVAFTPLQNSEHSGSVQALASGLPSAAGPGGAEDDEAPGGGGGGCCSSGGCRCCCSGGGGARAAGGSRGSGGGSSSLCLRLGREQRRYTLWDGLWILAAVAVYFADVGTDLWLAVDYYLRGQRWWFGLTLFFVLLGSLSVQVFSFRWFVHDFSSEDGAAAAAAGAPGSSSAGGHGESKLLVSSGSAAGDMEAGARPGTPQRQASNASKGNATNSTNSSSSTNAAAGGAAGAGGGGGGIRPPKSRSASCAFCIWLMQSLIHILQLGQIWSLYMPGVGTSLLLHRFVFIHPLLVPRNF
ncbi:XK-related protein 4 [Podarcis lilfordi]|uniref:XK-related protein n=1 Tax=Podarcis lilfordi TaxID=74358 RepID=A0AA35PCC5_9SAUR|nr:XK-related protein 4 [Podarcis lilfordi]